MQGACLKQCACSVCPLLGALVPTDTVNTRHLLCRFADGHAAIGHAGLSSIVRMQGTSPRSACWRPCCCTGPLPLHRVLVLYMKLHKGLVLCIWTTVAVVVWPCCLWLWHRLPATGRACNLHAAPDSGLTAAHSYVQQQCPGLAVLLKAGLLWAAASPQPGQVLCCRSPSQALLAGLQMPGPPFWERLYRKW